MEENILLAERAKLNYYPGEIYEYPREVRRKKKSVEKNKRIKRSRLAIKASCLFFGIIIMGISLFILFGYANITKMRMELTQLEATKVELEKNRLELEAELDGIKSSPNIMEDAKNKLGMSFPKEGQIAYISVGENQGNVLAKVDKKDNKVFKFISTLF